MPAFPVSSTPAFISGTSFQYLIESYISFRLLSWFAQAVAVEGEPVSPHVAIVQDASTGPGVVVPTIADQMVASSEGIFACVHHCELMILLLVAALAATL